MTTFLGTPVQVRGKIFGNLYLTEKHGGAEFDAEDEAVLRTLGAAAGVAIDNARLYDDARRRERWLAASSDLTRTLLSGADPVEVLHTFTATVRELSDADLVTLAVPVTGTTDLVIESAEGHDAELVRGWPCRTGRVWQPRCSPPASRSSVRRSARTRAPGRAARRSSTSARRS